MAYVKLNKCQNKMNTKRTQLNKKTQKTYYHPEYLVS